MAMKIRKHTNKNLISFIANNNEVVEAMGAYMQRYHHLLDTAFSMNDVTCEELEFLSKRYDAENDRLRRQATSMAIRIITRSVNKLNKI